MNKLFQKQPACALFSLVVISFLAAAPLRAEPPTTLHFQGYLTEPIGASINTTVDMTFALYDDPVTAGPLWAELHSVAVDNGLFSVVLGTLTPIELAFDTQIYLGITVGTDTELAPRLALGTSARTFRSATAEAVIEGGVIDVMIADGAITPDKLAPVCSVGEVLIMGALGWECGAVPCVAQPEICDGLDNDCNGFIDDGPNWDNKGDPCSVGVGTCAAQGLSICNDADPAGPTLCSASPGVPGVELCDGLDNDCNNLIDDDLSGSLCSNQTGVCLDSTATCGGGVGFLACGSQNYGPNYEFAELSCDGLDNDCDGDVDENLPLPPACALQDGVCAGATQVCGGAGGYLACTAGDYGPAYQPAESACDGLDNDCNGEVDEVFRDLATGQYVGDEHCGSCGNSCVGAFPNAAGFCDSIGTPVCAFICDPGYFDLNQNPVDVCEFSADPDGIYTSIATGIDASGCGDGPLTPCATIQFAMNEAQGLGRSTVYVADGIYVGLTLIDGISLRGGYRPDTWERHVATTQTIIRNDGTDPFTRTVIAEGISSPTVFEGFVVEGRDSQSAGGNSYALWVHDSQSGLTITNNVIVAGDGADGQRGDDGLAGQAGVAGGDGLDALDLWDAYGVFDNCTAVHHSPGGPGGFKTCGPTVTNGGDGGERVCPSLDGSETTPPVASENGESGANGGGVGGVPGRDALLELLNCSSAVIYGETFGTSGVDGSDGGAGGGAAGCTNTFGATNLGSGLWSPGVAGFGQPGAAAGGGGGGGSGAGTWNNFNIGACNPDRGGDNLGGTGGGGGAGGCGGAGGTAGTSGGGSFALFVSFSGNPGSNVPTVSDNVIYRSHGGDGGHGGFGSVGGLGGAGGSGGTAGNPLDEHLFLSAPGGDGGDGGDGGHGGGGGGGCGGPAYGIFFAAGSVPFEINAWKTDNLFPSGGVGGAGGPGGGALVNPGTDGNDGATGETNF